jgi:CRP-like cAMP-binding protein
MTTLPLFAARLTNPHTSKLAAEQVEASGHAETQRRICLASVRACPGMTAAEIALASGLERHIPSRRLPELRRAGLVVNGPARICRAMGSKAMTWMEAVT